MKAHRRLSRIKMPFYIRVFDEETNTVLGHMSKITVEGMMIISNRQIPVGSPFQLLIELSSDNEKRELLHVDAQSVWTRQDVNPDFYDIGFQFVNPSREVVNKIDALIDEFTI